MNDDLRRYLDGEVRLEALPVDARPAAEAWGRLLEAFRVNVPGGPAPAWLEDRVMAEIEALPRPGALGRALGWLLRPQPLRVPPAVAGLAFAAVVALLLVRGGGAPPPAGAGGGEGAAPVVYVQFLYEAPGAASVSVGGDFDGWSGSFELADADGDGVWSGRVPVRPGVYTYMFLLDGSTWVTDPGAERYTDDGFGNRNAVLAVAEPVS